MLITATTSVSQGIYPTLVIIICAVDQSLYEKSLADDQGLNLSITIPSYSNTAVPGDHRGTLSDLTSAASTYDKPDAVGSPMSNLGDEPKARDSLRSTLDGNPHCIRMLESASDSSSLSSGLHSVTYPAPPTPVHVTRSNTSIC